MGDKIEVLGQDERVKSDAPIFIAKDLPAVIQGQIGKLNELDVSIKKAVEAAENSKKSADRAEKMSAGFGKKKAAIEELQSAEVDLAGAVQSGAEAQKISFEFQTKLAQITKYLFGLGVSNIASNRFVVRELEMRLKGASQKELSELARDELISVVKQLKEQEDILKKQEDFSRALKIQYQKNRQIEAELQLQAETDRRHDEQLKLSEDSDKKIEEQLDEQMQLDGIQDKQLKFQEETDKRHDEQLKLHTENDKKFEKQLEVQSELDKLNSKKLQDQIKTDKRHDELFKVQHENIKMNEKRFVIMQKKYNKLLVKSENSLKSIELQKLEINRLNEEIHNLGNILDFKANKTLSIITLVIAIFAFAFSLLSLIIF